MILSTKLHHPRLQRDLHVERPTIIELLNKGLQTKLTVVTAPGGYGKTTALCHWLEQKDTPAAWISLDPQDNDLNRFWSYVVAAIDRQTPDFAEAMNPFLATLKSDIFETFISAMIHELSRRSNEFILMFDDFHLINLASIHASVIYLLERLPDHLHLYLASRAELPFPEARLQAAGQVVKITVRDLRFQVEEGIRYFQDCMAFTLSKEDVAMLVSRTEGWISGLHLAAISLKRGADYPEFIQAFSGEQRDISDYLFQEVLHRQTEEMQAFLLETSILNRMSAPLCEAVTGLGHCQELLETLEQQNLFIVPLDESRRWYRYHYLFSDFLRKQSRQKYPIEGIAMYARAAEWLEKHGYFEEAVEHLLMGEQYPAAVSLLEMQLHDLHLGSDVLRRWLRMLPDACFEGKPGIQLLYVKVMLESGEAELAETKLRMMEDMPFDAGTFYCLSAIVAFYRRDFARSNDFLEKFERQMPEGSYVQMAGANTYNINYDTLLVFFDDLHEAEAYFYRWIKVWEGKKDYPFVGFFYNAYCKILYEWNRLDEAEDYAARALRHKSMQPYALIVVHAAINVARIYQAKGYSARALELLEDVKSKIDSPDKHIFLKKLDAEKAILSLANGSADDAAAWLDQCEIQPADAVPLYRFKEYLYLANVLAECGRAAEALPLLDRLDQLAHVEDRHRDKLKVFILQSMVFHRLGDAKHALMKLEAALQLAEPGGYLRSFIEEGQRMSELLTLYLHQRQSHRIRNAANVSMHYVRRLLLMMNNHLDKSMISGEILTVQELNIFRAMETGLSNKQIAERIQIATETVKSHLKNIYKKLEVSSRAQAVHRGKALKLL